MTLQQDIKEIEDTLLLQETRCSIVDHLWNAEKNLKNNKELQERLSERDTTVKVSSCMEEAKRWQHDILTHKQIYTNDEYLPAYFAPFFNPQGSIFTHHQGDRLKHMFDKELCGRLILSEKKIVEIKEKHTYDLNMVIKQHNEDYGSVKHIITKIQEQNTSDLNILKEQHKVVYGLFQDDFTTIQEQHNTQLCLLKNKNMKLEELYENNNLVLEKRLYKLEHIQYTNNICIGIIIIGLVIINIYNNMMYI